MSSQALIHNGARKRIDSGHHTNIWTDPWLPDKLNNFIPLGFGYLKGLNLRERSTTNSILSL